MSKNLGDFTDVGLLQQERCLYSAARRQSVSMGIQKKRNLSDFTGTLIWHADEPLIILGYLNKFVVNA